MSRGVRVVLWRHGRTAWNDEGRFQGQTDVPLDSDGLAQAVEAAKLLASLQPDLLISSDLARAAQTAAALSEVTGLKVELDEGLRETHGGVFQGVLGSDIPIRFPAEYRAWRSDDPDARLGGGETRREVAERMVSAILRVAHRLDPGGLAVVATHGAAARLGIAGLIGLPLERVGSLGVLGNCSWSMVSRSAAGPTMLPPGPERWTLVEHNAGTLPQPVKIEEG